jgi:CMP-N,N'-diacetyllegionaminic acid synthase
LKSIGIIPARGGSKGIPHKNVVDLAGKPLIAYTIEEALKSSLNKVVVSTDCDRICEVATRYGVEVVKRPQNLSKDDTPTQPVIQHTLLACNEEFDLIATLQPTSPLRKAKHIDEAMNLIKKYEDADSLVSVVKVPHNMVPNSLMIKKQDFVENVVEQPKLVLRRQNKLSFYARNGAAIYLTKARSIKNYIFGGKILGYEMNLIESIDIDDRSDLQMAEILLNYVENQKF